MNSHSEVDDKDIVLKYFRLIKEKDMHDLLNLFTEDCRIYEPFSRGHMFNDNEGKDKQPLKGKSEIESFFHVVMMACDGLKHEIEFEYGPFRHFKLLEDTVISTSSTIVSTLATFYGNEGENKLRQKIIFHIVSEPGHDDTSDKIPQNRESNSNRNNNNNSNRNNNNDSNRNNIDYDRRRIKSLCVQFFAPK
jgi:hypothetical protein